MSRRTKSIAVVTLLTLTAFVLGLTMNIIFSAQAASTDISSVAAAPAADPQNPFGADNFMPDELSFMMQGARDMLGGPNADGNEAQGVITKIENSGSKITVGKRIVNTDGATIGNATGTLTKDKLAVGNRVTALGVVAADKSLDAKWVLVLPNLPKVQGGTITSVDATTLKFKNPKGEEWTATLKTDGKVLIDGKEAKLSDLKANARVVVVGDEDATAKTIKADRISSGTETGKPGAGTPRNNMEGGKVKSVDVAGNTFTFTRKDKDGKDVDTKVTVDANTKYAGDLKSLSDVKVDANVFVLGEKQTDGSIKATTVGTGKPAGPGRPGGPGKPGEVGFDPNA